MRETGWFWRGVRQRAPYALAGFVTGYAIVWFLRAKGLIP